MWPRMWYFHLWLVQVVWLNPKVCYRSPHFYPMNSHSCGSNSTFLGWFEAFFRMSYTSSLYFLLIRSGNSCKAKQTVSSFLQINSWPPIAMLDSQRVLIELPLFGWMSKGPREKKPPKTRASAGVRRRWLGWARWGVVPKVGWLIMG